jgi:hypothetical protein
MKYSGSGSGTTLVSDLFDKSIIFAHFPSNWKLWSLKVCQLYQYKHVKFANYSVGLIESSVADPDPGLGAFLPLDPGSGMGESQHPDPGSGMNNPDHFFRA